MLSVLVTNIFFVSIVLGVISYIEKSYIVLFFSIALAGVTENFINSIASSIILKDFGGKPEAFAIFRFAFSV
jgi:hypothetical protein